MQKGNQKWSIPTTYKDIQMRSKLEAKWAKWFDENGIKWIYEPEGFEKDDVRYLPDFALPSLRIIFEVKGVMGGEDEKKKQIMTEICEAEGWKYVMGFSEIGECFLCDSIGNEFEIKLATEKTHSKVTSKKELHTSRVRTPEDELMALYLFHPATRGYIELLFGEYNEIVHESYRKFFRDVKRKFAPYDAIKQLKNYFDEEQIEFFLSKTELHDTSEGYQERIDYYESVLKKIKVKRDVNILDEKIRNEKDSGVIMQLLKKRMELTNGWRGNNGNQL